MGSQNSKKKVKKLSRDEQNRIAVKNAKYTKIFLLVFACIAIIGVILGIIFGIMAAIDAGRYNDFVTHESNMYDYVYLDPEIYKSFDVNMPVNIPGEHEVELAIMKLLYDNRKNFTTDDFNGDGIKNDSYNSDNIKNQTIRLGDTANIFYRGYYLNEDNERVYFNGGCNFAGSSSSSDKPASLGIGSGSFVDGFETGLIGKNMKDFATLERFSSKEEVLEDDIVYISYDCFFYDGSAKKGQHALVDLSDPSVDEIWGEGFREFLTGATAGVTIKDPYTVTNKGSDGSAEDDVYSSVTVEKIIRITKTQDRPVLEIEVTFPLSYDSEELAGKTGWFEVFIMTTQLYDTPQFNDEFITETLKVTAEELKDYEGETLTQKYRAKILEEKLAEHEDVIYDTFVSAMWKHYLDKVEVKKYPMGDVKQQYDAVVSDIESFYNYYKSSYGFSSVKDAAQVYLQYNYGVTEYTDWQSAVMEQAKLAVKRMMTMYYVMQDSGFVLSDEEFAAAYEDEYNETFESYLENKNCTPDKYEKTEEYENAKAEHKKTFDTYYTENYFTETVHYNHALDEILANYANIVYPQ